MSKDPTKHLGDYAKRGSTHGFPKGVSGNPGGKVSLKLTHEWACANDPEFAAACGVSIAEARGRLYALQMKIACAGPKGANDRNWALAMDDMMNRHFGKPKEFVEITQGESPAVDWSKVPVEDREEMLRAIQRLQAYVGEPETDSEH